MHNSALLSILAMVAKTLALAGGNAEVGAVFGANSGSGGLTLGCRRSAARTPS